MRYYICTNGKLSSITISDTLSQYLVIARGGESDRYGDGKKRAQRWISELANQHEVPSRDVSQWVQARILDYIVNPMLQEKLEELQPKIAAKLAKKAAREASFMANALSTAGTLDQ